MADDARIGGLLVFERFYYENGLSCVSLPPHRYHLLLASGYWILNQNPEFDPAGNDLLVNDCDDDD